MVFCITPLTKCRTLFDTVIEGVYGNSKIYLNLDFIYEEETEILEEMSECLNKIAEDPFYPLNLLKRDINNRLLGLIVIDNKIDRFSLYFFSKNNLGDKKKKIKELLYQILFNDLEKIIVNNNYTIVILEKKYHGYMYTFTCKKCKKRTWLTSHHYVQIIKCRNCLDNISEIIVNKDDTMECIFLTRISQKILEKN
jgi:hypothetical protein